MACYVSMAFSADEAVLWLAETDRSPPITGRGLQVPINVSNQREVARWARKTRETCKHIWWEMRSSKSLGSSLPPSFPPSSPIVSPTQLMEVGQRRACWKRVRSAPVPGGALLAPTLRRGLFKAAAARWLINVNVEIVLILFLLEKRDKRS